MFICLQINVIDTKHRAVYLALQQRQGSLPYEYYLNKLWNGKENTPESIKGKEIQRSNNKAHNSV